MLADVALSTAVRGVYFTLAGPMEDRSVNIGPTPIDAVCPLGTLWGQRQSRLARAAPTALLFEHSTKAGSQIVAARRYSDAALKNYALIPVVPAVPIMMVVRVRCTSITTMIAITKTNAKLCTKVLRLSSVRALSACFFTTQSSQRA